nr:G-type lectin S-receptor-like serine/threonine-protein kinase At1g67520 [Ipomoea trifida]
MIVCCLFIWHGLLLSGVSAKNTLASEESLLPTDDDYLESSNKLFKLNFVKQPGSAFSCFLSIQWAGMKLGWFRLKKTPQQRCLTSWTSEENPYPGAFRLCVDPNNTKQLVAMRRGVVYWHSGVWNGYNFPFFQVYSHFRYISNHNESYFVWDDDENSVYKDFGVIRIYATGAISYLFVDEHRNYTRSYIYCDRNDTGYYSNEGCLRSPKQSNCSVGDMFNLTTGFIEADLWKVVLFNTTLSIDDCNEMCVKNCSCNAYATLEESDGTGCKFSSSTKYQYAAYGDTLYIRYAKPGDSREIVEAGGTAVETATESDLAGRAATPQGGTRDRTGA